jgi:hypothetical protein
MDQLGEACLVLGFAYLCSGLILALPFPRTLRPPSPGTEERSQDANLLVNQPPNRSHAMTR